MCLKVSRLFGSSPEVWMRLQAAYDSGEGAAKQEGYRARKGAGIKRKANVSLRRNNAKITRR